MQTAHRPLSSAALRCSPLLSAAPDTVSDMAVGAVIGDSSYPTETRLFAGSIGRFGSGYPMSVAGRSRSVPIRPDPCRPVPGWLDG